MAKLDNDDYTAIGNAIAAAMGKSNSNSFQGGGQQKPAAPSAAALDTSSAKAFGDSLKKATADGVDGFGSAVKNSTGTLGELSKRGQNFSNDLVGMNVAAANSRIGLNDFAGVVAENGKGLAGLGGSVTRGAEAFGKLSKGFFDSRMTDELQQMGYSAKDLNQVLAIQASTQRSTLGNDAASRKASYESAASLAKEMDLISKLTGKNREEQMEEAKKRAADGQVEAKLRLIGIEQGAEAEAAARAAFQEQFAKAEARGQGQMAKELFATGTVTSQEAATQFALTGEAAQKLAQQMDYLGKGNIEAANRASKEADAANAKNQRDPTLLRLATLGSAAGDAGMIMKKNVEDNMALHDSVVAYAKANGIALNSVKDFGKALDGVQKDLKASQSGRKQVDNDVAKAGGKYEDVSGLNKGVVATRVAGQEVGSGVAQAVGAKDKDGRSIAGDLNQGGRAVESAIGSLSPNQSLGRTIGEAAEKGAASGGKEGGAIGVATDKAIVVFNGATDLFNSAVNTFAREIKGFAFGAPKATPAASTASPVNAAPEAPKKELGGIVPGTIDGTTVTVGEKGKPEAIVPLDQLSKMIGAKTSESSKLDLTSISKSINTSISSVSGGGSTETKRVQSDSSKAAEKELASVQEQMQAERQALREKLKSQMGDGSKLGGNAVTKEMRTGDEGKAIAEKYKAMMEPLQKKIEEGISFEVTKKASAIEETTKMVTEQLSITKSSSGKLTDLLNEDSKNKLATTKKDVESLSDMYKDDSKAKLDLAKKTNADTFKEAELAKSVIGTSVKGMSDDMIDAMIPKGAKIEDYYIDMNDKLQSFSADSAAKMEKNAKDSANIFESYSTTLSSTSKKISTDIADVLPVKDIETKSKVSKEKMDAAIAEQSKAKDTLAFMINNIADEDWDDEAMAAWDKAMETRDAATEKIATIKEDLTKDMPNPADLIAGGGSLKVNGKEVDPNSKEGKETQAQMEEAKLRMIGIKEGAEAEMKARKEAAKEVKVQEPTAGKPGGVATAKDPSQMTTEELIARDSKNVQNRTAKVDLNALQLPGFGPQMKFSASGAAAEAKKKEEDAKAAEAKKTEDAKKKEDDTKSEKKTEGKSAGPGTKSATLDDVVKKLDALNTSMNKLIDTHVTVGKQQVSAVKSNSGNMYDKA